MTDRIPRLYPILDTGLLARRNVIVEPGAARRILVERAGEVEGGARRNVTVERTAEAMLEGGARLLQFRHKGHFSRALFTEAERVAGLCRRAGALFIVDDRADIALLLDAGLHVGQDDLPPAEARRLIGPGRMLGFSTHNLAQFAAALEEPVDYVAFGPVFPTQTKENPDPVVGVGALRTLRALAERPLVAIGGITRDNALQVLAAGADSVAVISDLLPDPCTFEAVRTRMEEWQRLVRS